MANAKRGGRPPKPSHQTAASSLASLLSPPSASPLPSDIAFSTAPPAAPLAPTAPPAQVQMRHIPQLSIAVAPTTNPTSPTSLLSSSSSSSSALLSASTSSMPSLSPLLFSPEERHLNLALTPSTSYFSPSDTTPAVPAVTPDAPSSRLRERTGEKRYREVSDEEEETKGEQEDLQETEYREAEKVVETAKVRSGANQGSFIPKLYQLILEPATDHLVAFSLEGDNFTIFDPDRFAKEVLSRYYRHGNFASFTRQLNMYGFRKVARGTRGAPMSDQVWCFFHPKFRRGDMESIGSIRRNPVEPSVISTLVTSLASDQASSPKRRLSHSKAARTVTEGQDDKQFHLKSPAQLETGEAVLAAPVEENDLPPASPLAPVPDPALYSPFSPSSAESLALPPPVAAPSAPRLRQLSGPFTFVPLASGLTAANGDPYSDPTAQGLPPSPAETTETLRRERDDLLALSRQMHRDLHIFSRQLKEMTDRCEMSVNVAANLKALVLHRGGEQDLSDFPDFLFDPRFTNPAASLAEIRAAPRPRLPLALQQQPPPTLPYTPYTPNPPPLPVHPVSHLPPHIQQSDPPTVLASTSQHSLPNLPLVSTTHHPHYLHVETQHLTPSSSAYSASLHGSAEEPAPHSHFSTWSSSSEHGVGAGVGLGITFESGVQYGAEVVLSRSPEHATFEQASPSEDPYPPYQTYHPSVVPRAALSPVNEGRHGLDPSNLPSHLSTSSLNSFNGGPASSSATSSPEQAWASDPLLGGQATLVVAGGGGLGEAVEPK